MEDFLLEEGAPTTQNVTRRTGIEAHIEGQRRPNVVEQV
jgi:hypothetical protein